VIDGQSVKTTESGDPRGYAAEKMIKGRKRHILTDIISRRVGMIALPANVQDCDGAPDPLASVRNAFPWLRHVFADGGYAKRQADAACVWRPPERDHETQSSRKIRAAALLERFESDSDQKSDAPAGASAADTTASDGNAPVITATTSLITVVFGLTMAVRRPNR
jgi:hypothetical protein